MCGIAGIWSTNARVVENLREHLSLMSQSLKHRGPDSDGLWLDPHAGFGVTHTRLSILDLSSEGHQPMASTSSRYIVSLNGEIYNHLQLRDQLFQEKKHTYWRGHSDTETLLACIEAWGIERSLESLHGMFAFALWDRHNHELTLCRDRFGEKPLYYGFNGSNFLFASQLSALRSLPFFNPSIDYASLGSFLQSSSVPAPYSIYQNIHKLNPGSHLQLRASNILDLTLPPLKHYWSLGETIEKSLQNPFHGSFEDATDLLDDQLKNIISRQLLTDVPLGSFLSGGIDSSLVTAITQSLSSSPVQTFSIGSDVPSYNEAHFAEAIAAYLGCNHNTLYLSSTDALNTIPLIPTLYDEPFADSSQIPTILLSKYTKQSVTVALTGDAGDEVFGGYNRYCWTTRISNRILPFPQILRTLASRSLTAISPSVWTRIAKSLYAITPNQYKYPMFGDKVHKTAAIIDATNALEIYSRLISTWQSVSELVSSPIEPIPLLSSIPDHIQHLEIEHLLMYLDTVNYLPNDILHKVDRASMGFGLETRIPFLDHQLVQYAWSLPLAYKVSSSSTKHILRNLLSRYIPPNLTDRPKMGFGIPLDSWLRGPLRDWSSELLHKDKLIQSGLNPDPILKCWDEHISERRNWQYHLWNILTWQSWFFHQPF